MGFFQALWRFITFYKLRKALGLARAADEQFTSTPQGIKDAYTILEHDLIEQAKQDLQTLGELESACQDMKVQIEGINGQVEKLDKSIRGAANIYQTTTDAVKKDKAKVDGNNFLKQKKQLIAQRESLQTLHDEQDKQLQALEQEIQRKQVEIQQAKSQGANMAARMAIAQRLKDAHERRMGLRSQIDRGPAEAAEKAVKDAEAQARAAGRVSNAANSDLQQEYIDAGEGAETENEFEQLVKADQARREKKTGDTPPADKDDRPDFLKN